VSTEPTVEQLPIAQAAQVTHLIKLQTEERPATRLPRMK
jgi:hypothetical protein